ncbi:MAG TPA: DUF58 domain-containing protein [Acidimicrobiales bacterium]|jgi:uncharacterized protein (DUF58 family)|nr:DUF58 domain-containing protein [Acidimicrobiales bacterium]
MTATVDIDRRTPGQTTSAARRAQARFDRVRDALGPRAVRRRLDEWQRKFGVTALGATALLAAVSLWIVARVIAGTAMYLFAYGALLIFAMSVAIAPRNLKLKGEREGLFPRGREGDRFDVTLTMEARRRVTTFMLEERVPERLGRTVKVPVTKLSKGEIVEHRYGLRCTRRGVYRVGPLVAVAQDPLGLFKRETVVAEPFELLVHPRIEVVSDRALTRAHEDPPIRPPVSRPWPSGMEFYGMREYVPGDDVRRIVWRASARTGKTMVWDAEQGITDRITIILDTDRTNHSREAEDLSESFETGVRVAASLAVRHLRDNYEVRLEVNGGPLVRPQRGTRAQTEILDSLARVDTDREPLTKAIHRLIANPQRDAHNVLVTPRLGELEAAQLRLFLNTGVSVLVIALLWDDEDTFTVARAAALGCQVIGIHPGDDLKTALYQSGASVG